MKKTYRSITALLFSMIALSVVSSVIAAGPTGANPNDPLTVPTSSQTIAPNITLWFYFDYAVDHSGGMPGGFGAPPAGFGGGPPMGAMPSNSKSQAKTQVTVDANGAQALQFAIYTPDQAKAWVSDSSTPPVGRGTPYRNTSSGEITHDLYWDGAFNSSGRYLIAVTNNSSTSISFRMTVTGEAVTLYPAATATPTATLDLPITVTPVPTTTIQGKILFERATGDDIYSVNGDGTNLTRVSRGIDPSWSPDGKQITFARWDNGAPGIYIANADGSNERIIYTTPRVRWPHLSPDGKYVVFSQDKTKDEQNTVWKLGVVEVGTGKLIEPQCSKQCFVPSWSKDSTTIVFTDPNIGILKTSILGGAESIVFGPNDSNIHLTLIQNSEISPDGKTIAYSQIASNRWEINTINLDGSNQTGVTKPDPIQSILYDKVVHNVTPTWSSDGKQILFLSDRNGKWEFFFTDADGSNVRQVLKNVTDQVNVKFSFENERIMDWNK